MNDTQTIITFPVRKSARRKIVKIADVQDKENSPTKKSLRSNKVSIIYKRLETFFHIYKIPK